MHVPQKENWASVNDFRLVSAAHRKCLYTPKRLLKEANDGDSRQDDMARKATLLFYRTGSVWKRAGRVGRLRFCSLPPPPRECIEVHYRTHTPHRSRPLASPSIAVCRRLDLPPPSCTRNTHKTHAQSKVIHVHPTMNRKLAPQTRKTRMLTQGCRGRSRGGL